MKNVIAITAILSMILISTPAYTEIPHHMQFQGKATDDQDVPLDGTYDLKFRIYYLDTGGSPIWEEIHTSVPVETGAFSVLLGGVTPLDIPFDVPYWISVEIDTVDGSNELPRQLITSSGYAYRAEEADHADVADTLTEFVIETRTDDPPNPKLGQIWLRTDVE